MKRKYFVLAEITLFILACLAGCQQIGSTGISQEHLVHTGMDSIQVLEGKILSETDAIISMVADTAEELAKTETPESVPEAEEVPEKYLDDEKWYQFVGRLHIPDLGIDVALYDDSRQGACDRVDSACCFSWQNQPGKIIADHSNQDFSVLHDAAPGMTGYIVLSSGEIVNIRCVEAARGHNTGMAITDLDYTSVIGMYDYLMYTCMNGWQNIWYCQWTIV